MCRTNAIFVTDLLVFCRFFVGLGFSLSYLLNHDRIRLGKPTLEGTLRRFGIAVPGAK